MVDFPLIALVGGSILIGWGCGLIHGTFISISLLRKEFREEWEKQKKVKKNE